MSKVTTLGQLRALGVASESYTAEVAATAADAIEVIEDELATAEGSSTASAAHAAGSYVRFDEHLYKVTQAIAIGDTIAEGVNVAQTSVAEELELFSGRTAGLTYTAATETINVPTSIGSYADETIIFTV